MYGMEKVHLNSINDYIMYQHKVELVKNTFIGSYHMTN